MEFIDSILYDESKASQNYTQNQLNLIFGFVEK